jgi:hypothetical protein
VKPAGPRDVFASAPGYAEDFASGTEPSTGTSTPVVIRLHKVQVNAILVRLDWGSTPSDLDSHLSGPDLAGGRFHCFFVDRNPVPYVALDADDVTAFGPETITISRSPAGGALSSLATTTIGCTTTRTPPSPARRRALPSHCRTRSAHSPRSARSPS